MVPRASVAQLVSALVVLSGRTEDGLPPDSSAFPPHHNAGHRG